MVNKLIDGVTFLKSKFQTDELDEKLNQAVSQENWQASTQLLHQIANASYNYEKEQRIIGFIWEKLKHKSWKKVLKTLHLVDFLAKNGPTSMVNAFKENIYEFRNFDNYTLVSEGIDRGESIRKQSKVIVDTLSDDHFLNDERAKAKKIKQRMANVIGSGAYYGNFSNDGDIGGFKKESYESFGSNNYKLPPNSNGGMSFGESVMKTLQESKKGDFRVQQKQIYVQKEPQKVQTSKLNLSKMNERKPEQSKKIFNNLNSKLVKPPQKKVQKSNPQPQPLPQPQQQKPKAKVNIMDLDLFGFGDNKQANQVEFKQENSNSNIDPFDFLSTTPPQTKSTQQTVVQNQPIFNIDLNQSPLKQQQTIHNPYPQPIQTTPALNFFNTSQTQPQKAAQSTFTQPSLSSNISISLNPPQPIKSSLTQATKKASQNLIDFSNFRQQLNLIGHKQQKKSIVQQWNW